MLLLYNDQSQRQVPHMDLNFLPQSGMSQPYLEQYREPYLNSKLCRKIQATIAIMCIILLIMSQPAKNDNGPTLYFRRRARLLVFRRRLSIFLFLADRLSTDLSICETVTILRISSKNISHLSRGVFLRLGDRKNSSRRFRVQSVLVHLLENSRVCLIVQDGADLSFKHLLQLHNYEREILAVYWR